jgi:uncharacterized protein (DUF1330 family)
MRTQYTVALSMLAGAALGAVSVGGLYAQGKSPGAYAVFAFTDIGDAAAWKTNVVDPATPLIPKHGGQFIVRTNEVTALRAGEQPLKRLVIIGFDNVQQAKAWWSAPEMKTVNSYVEQHGKGSTALVEASK